MSEQHEDMVIDLRTDDLHDTVTVTGEIDIATAPALHRKLTAALTGSAPSVTADLTGVTFIDSSAMGVILSSHKRAGHLGKRLIVRLPVGRARFPFEVTGLAAMFEPAAASDVTSEQAG